jgi:acid phosphatase (class A)
MKNCFILLAVLVCVSLSSGYANSNSSTQLASGHNCSKSTFLPGGYLDESIIPNSQLLLLPPPTEGSAAQALDAEVSRKSLALHGTPRWDLAIVDAKLNADSFSCALHTKINEQNLPHLFKLLQRVAADASNSTNEAKFNYCRPRPFVENQQLSCTPEEQTKLARNGSYPSGHTAIGWAWALILSEIAPEQTVAVWLSERAV